MRVSRILSGGIRQGNFSNHHIKGIAKIEMNAWETVWYRVSNYDRANQILLNFRF